VAGVVVCSDDGSTLVSTTKMVPGSDKSE
jgi:hypothetical protein